MFLCPGDAEGGGHDQLRDRVRPQAGLRSHQVTLHCYNDVGLQTEVRKDFTITVKAPTWDFSWMEYGMRLLALSHVRHY